MNSQIQFADDFRNQGAYDNATKIYSDILKEEPDNFSALNGLMLCENNLNKLTDISGLLTKGTFAPKMTSLTAYKNRCKAEHRDYFVIAEKLISMGQDYMNLTNKSKSKEYEIHMLQSQIHKNQAESEKLFPSSSRVRRTSSPSAKLVAGFILNVEGVERHEKPYVPFTFTIIYGIFAAIVIGIYILLCVKFEEIRHSLPLLGVYGALILLVLGITANYLIKDMKAYKILRPNKQLKLALEAAITEKNSADTERNEILDTIKKSTWEVKKHTPKDC